MEITFQNVKAGKDDKGFYILISMPNRQPEKIYLEEIFEEIIEGNEPFNLTIKPQSDEFKSAGMPNIPTEEINRVRIALNLKPKYDPLSPKFNIHNHLQGLYSKYPPMLQFNARNEEEYKKWKEKARNKLIELIGYDYKKSNIDFEMGPKTELDDLILQKISFQTGDFLNATAILAYKKEITKDNPAPAIICLHGHNKGKICTCGMYHSNSGSYYGLELAKKGFVTLSLDQWGWGEREGKRKKALSNPESHYALVALLLGKTAIGIRTVDVSKSIDFLETLNFIEKKFAVIGQSGGGTTSTFSSALDERIDVAVISGYFCDSFESIFSLNHCACNYVPGILKYLDIPDIVALRAPKPTFIVSGEKDPIFPQDGVQSAYKKLKRAFDLFGKPENLDIDVIKGARHVFRGDLCYPFLEKHLKIN